ncbi:S41 family peptidase [Flavitalea flava]
MFIRFTIPLFLLLLFFSASGQKRAAPSNFPAIPQNTENGKAREDTLLTRLFSFSDLQQDFIYLRKALEETHPGLYRYLPKEMMNYTMDSIYGRIKDSMGFYEYYTLLASFVSQIRCAHTSLLPAENWQDIYKTRMRLFPYQLYTIGEHTYFILNQTRDTLIRPGYELLAINGLTINSVRNRIFSHLWADGYNETSKKQMMNSEMFALAYYWWVERPDSFVVNVKSPDGRIFEQRAAALVFPEIQKNMVSNVVNKELLKIYGKRNQLDQKKSWRLEISKDRHTAVLVIRGFGGGENGTEARRKMHDFMERAVQQLRDRQIEHLIIDLRFNGGGWDNQGEELITYLIHKPTLYYRRMHTVTNSSSFLRFSDVPKEEIKNLKNELIPETDGTFTLTEKFTEELAVQQPKPNAFTGKLYFLVNGASGSTTSEFTAVAQANHLGIFIGEETGGNYTGGNGSSFIGLVLPHTGIKLGIPLAWYDNAVDIPVPEGRVGRGTFPDYEVPDTLEAVLKGRINQLEFAFDLIKKGK